VRKLTNKKVQWIIRELEKGKPPDDIARFVRVSRRRIYQLKQQYTNTGLTPELKDPGRKKKPLDPEFERIIQDAYHIYKSGPVILEKIIKIHYGLAIPHNTIYRVMLMHQLVIENPRKKGQRKWVRFERKHSMSLWQGDWKEFEFKGSKKWIIAFIDDSSRLITCYGIFDSPTTENTLTVLNQGFREYGTPREILTDHGTQFVSVWDCDLSHHSFKDFLDKNNINHIIARVKHPQTNGKIERWFGLLEQKLKLFNSVNEFVLWYNTIKPHMSLNLDECETPEQAFWRKLSSERILNYSKEWFYATTE
jgi:putative transposase